MTSAAVPHVALTERPSYLAAALAALGVLLLYLLTLAPTTSMWDTSEYIAAAYTVGLPHPPGNPLFVLIGRVFALLPVAPTVAMRINVLAALSSAASAFFWFLITERVLVPWLPHRWQRLTGAALSALIGATAFTVWNQSVVNEKVYTVSLLGLAAISWLMVRWCDDPDGPTADRLLVLVAFLLGLGYANHMAGMLAAPAAGLAVLVHRPRTLLRWKLLLACAAALAFGITPFATQPIRAAHFPAINEGEPTGCTTEISVACTFSATTYDRFLYNFNRGQYGKPDLTQRQAPFTAQVGMYWLYFKWQYWRDAYGERPGLQNALAVLFLILGLLGGWVHWSRDRRSFWYMGPLVFIMTLGLIYYLNFKYGHSQALELGRTVEREVRDRDYFYLWAFSAWSVWAALGLVYLWESFATLMGNESVRVGNATVSLPTRRSFLIASPVLLVAAMPLVGNWEQASRANQTDTADFAADLLNSVEPYGMLVTVGDNDTFPLWYAQEVEGVRKDVLVVNTSLLNTDWYTRQVIRRPVYEYDKAAGPAVYRDRDWPRPEGPALRLSFEEADAIPLYIDLGEQRTFQKNDLVATARRARITRAELLIYFLMRDSWPERPLYFSRTAGGLPGDLGFAPYVLTQGLARRIADAPVIPGRDTVLVRGEGMVDVTRSAALWRDTFKANRSLAARNGWVDDASLGIPDLYVITGLGISEALANADRGAASDSVFHEARAIAKAMRRESVFGLDRPEFDVRPADQAPPTPLLLPPTGDSMIPPAPPAP